MKFKDIKKTLADCNDDTDIIIYVKDEFGYRPFENIHAKYYGKICSGYLNELSINVSIETEYKNIHFPNNPTKEEIEELWDKKRMLIEEMKDVDEYLGVFKNDFYLQEYEQK